MGKRRLRSALDIISDIGSLGFDLQYHSDEDIETAMKLMRYANPEMFVFLSRVLGPPLSPAALDPVGGTGTEGSTREKGL